MAVAGKGSLPKLHDGCRRERLLQEALRILRGCVRELDRTGTIEDFELWVDKARALARR
jgi:hypothetical protein